MQTKISGIWCPLRSFGESRSNFLKFPRVPPVAGRMGCLSLISFPDTLPDRACFGCTPAWHKGSYFPYHGRLHETSSVAWMAILADLLVVPPPVPISRYLQKKKKKEQHKTLKTPCQMRDCASIACLHVALENSEEGVTLCLERSHSASVLSPLCDSSGPICDSSGPICAKENSH